MKKILILNHNQENFGTYYRCLFLGKELAGRGYDITMVSASGRSFDLLVRKRKISEHFTLITLPRVKYHKYFTGQIIFRLPLAMLIVLLFRYDLCFAFTVAQTQIGLPAWAARIIRRKKLIVDWDDLWGGGFAEEHARPIAGILGFSERYFVRFADRITYVSDEIGRRIDALGLADRKAMIPNGANADQIGVLDKAECRSAIGLDREGTYLVSVGNTYTDSLGLMLEAFGEFRKAEKAKLIMVGEGEIVPKFRPLFESLKEDIIVTGKRPFSEIPRYLGSADALLLPMDDNLMEKARFPMRFGDYLSSGRPIVSNAVGEVARYIREHDCGLASDPLSVSEFAANMLRAVRDQKTAKRIGANARKLAEGELGWGNIGRKLDDLAIRPLIG